MEIQLDLFEDENFEQKTEIEILKQDIKAIEEMSHNVRKGLFKRHNDLIKEIIKLSEEMAQLRQMMIKQVK